MDNKTLATILFRVLGVSYLLYGIFYAPHLLITSAYNHMLIMYSLEILTYFALGVCLLLLSRLFGGLVVKGLLLNNSTPPPPPNFKNS